MSEDLAALMIALEAIGDEWAERRLPNDLLRDARNVRLIVAVEDLLWSGQSEITSKAIEQQAPTFFEQFELATLRPLGKSLGHPREVAASVI